MALKPKYKGEDKNNIMTDLVEDKDALVNERTGKESRDINEDLITKREFDKRHKEYR